MAISKENNTEFLSSDLEDNSNSDSEEDLPMKTLEGDNTKLKAASDDSFHSDFEESLSPKTSEEDSSWVRVLDHELESDFREDSSTKTSDDENSWVKVLDHSMDSDFQEDHPIDYDFKEDLPMESTSLKKATAAPKSDIVDNLALHDKSPGHLLDLDTQFSEMLELKDKNLKNTLAPKCNIEHSCAKGSRHSCNFDAQLSKKLKLYDGKGLKDIIEMHALPFLPAKSLCRFRSVCKDWVQRINHPFMAHQQTNKFKDISGVFCQLPPIHHFVSFDGTAYGIPSPCFSFLPDLVNVKSTCNGLVCCQCSRQANIYYVCNPVTKKWTQLPKPNLLHELQTIATLAFEPSALNFAPHYALVCAVVDESSDCPAVHFEIYFSRTDTWRVSETVCYEADALTLCTDGFYMKENVYWKTLSGAILTFHLKDDEYSILQLPPNHGLEGALTHLHGQLCYILPVIRGDKCVISIYGDANMSLKYQITLPQKISGVYCQALPSLNDEMLIILLEDGVIAYHVRAKKVETLSKEWIFGYQTVLPYINTLVEIATPNPELETVAY